MDGGDCNIPDAFLKSVGIITLLQKCINKCIKLEWNLMHLSIHFCNNIQLMHSFEVNIRICQPENSDVHQGEAEVNITFEG